MHLFDGSEEFDVTVGALRFIVANKEKIFYLLKYLYGADAIQLPVYLSTFDKLMMRVYTSMDANELQYFSYIYAIYVKNIER